MDNNELSATQSTVALPSTHTDVEGETPSKNKPRTKHYHRSGRLTRAEEAPAPVQEKAQTETATESVEHTIAPKKQKNTASRSNRSRSSSKPSAKTASEPVSTENDVVASPLVEVTYTPPLASVAVPEGRVFEPSTMPFTEFVATPNESAGIVEVASEKTVEKPQRQYRFDRRAQSTTNQSHDSRTLGPLSTIWKRPETTAISDEDEQEVTNIVAHEETPVIEAMPTSVATPVVTHTPAMPTRTREASSYRFVPPARRYEEPPIEIVEVEPENVQVVVDIVEMPQDEDTVSDTIDMLADDMPSVSVAPEEQQQVNHGRKRSKRGRREKPSTTTQHVELPQVQDADTDTVADKQGDDDDDDMPSYSEVFTATTPAMHTTQVKTPPNAPQHRHHLNSHTQPAAGFVDSSNNQTPMSPYGSPEPSFAKGFGPTPRGVASEYRTPSLTRSTRSDRFTDTTNNSALSVGQIATMISDALRQQTDRLVAEQHRISSPMFTVAMPSTERVGVFVDVANLLYSSRSMRIPIDFGKLLGFLKSDRRLVRAHAYCPTSPEPFADQQFLQAVKGLGYRITTKDYKTFSSGARKADLDLDLCMDIVRIVDSQAVDTIILVSGDSDFLPLLEYCSDHGVRVEVAAFDESTAAILRQSCDLFVNLSVIDAIRA